MNDGEVIRLPFPKLTEETRKELAKKVSQKAEEERVEIRNIRREANSEAELLEDEGEISEDDYHRALEKIQEMTDSYIDKIDKLLDRKENEIMEV